VAVNSDDGEQEDRGSFSSFKITLNETEPLTDSEVDQPEEQPKKFPTVRMVVLPKVIVK
jgi:hypothetical protein